MPRSFLWLVFQLIPSVALGAVPTFSSMGVPIRWSTARLELAGNPANLSGLSDVAVREAAVVGLQRWSAASRGRVDFDYWQGSDDSLFEPNSNLNGQSSLYFASRVSGAGGLAIDPQVLGLTQVWYRTQSGEILEADIVLNDVHFRFSLDPRDTTGLGSTSGYGSSVFLENVLTHELGHALGLAHSGVMQSTMLFTEGPDQYHLACDDQLGIRSLYSSEGGVVRVTVQGESGAPLEGAHVLALSREQGTVLRSAVADRGGIATLSALEAGTFDFVVEPSSLSSAATQARPCPGDRPLRRGFLMPGLATQGDAGVVRLGCDPDLSAAGGQALLRFGESSAAGVYVFSKSGERLRIESSGGDLVVRLLSFSLYSPVTMRARLRRDAGGSPAGVVPVREVYPLYSSESGFSNYDSEIRVPGLVPGVYWLELRGAFPSVQLYPAGPLGLDGLPFYVVQVVRPDSAGELGATNSRCVQDESGFSTYQSPPGDPPRRDPGTFDESGGAACATVSASGGGGPPGRAVGLLAAWLLLLYLVKEASKVALRPIRA